MSDFKQIKQALIDGEVIAYPTEGVFGLGCDPDNAQAIERLLALKQRSVEKGLILIAASYEQVLPYIDLNELSREQITQIRQSWPGPVTWVIPASDRTSSWVSGQFDSVAVRVSDHPVVRAICHEFGKPITSTSANLSGQPPCMSSAEVEQQLGGSGVYIVAGETGGRDKPSEIRDARTSIILRQG